VISWSAGLRPASDAMNCQVVQNKIIAEPDPRLLSERLRLHVAGCAACRAWAEQAARLEGLLEQLPAPSAPTAKKAALVDELERGEPIIARPMAAPAADRSRRESRFVGFLRDNALVLGGLAAAVLVVWGAWSLLPRNGVRPDLAAIPDDPFLKKMVERDVAMARATTPEERLKVLSGMADDLSTQARGLARVASPDELRDLAKWYDKVVKNGIVKQTENMPVRTRTPAEEQARIAALNALTKQLGDTAAETDTLLASVPPDAKPALQKIVETARDGQKKVEVAKFDTEMHGKSK
jgi:hypothetical protein